MADNEDTDQEQEQESGRKKKLLIFGGIGLLVLMLVGIGGFMFLAGGGEEPETGAKAKVETKRAPALYHSLGNKFTVNVDDEGRQRFMQVAISIKTRDPATVDALVTHDPLIRSRLTLLLGNQTYDAMRTPEGKLDLQKAVFETVQQVLDEEAGGLAIEEVLFTDLVLQ